VIIAGHREEFNATMTATPNSPRSAACNGQTVGAVSLAIERFLMDRVKQKTRRADSALRVRFHRLTFAVYCREREV